MSFTSSFTSIFAPIGRSLGFGQENEVEDVRATRRKFGMVGFDDLDADEAEDQVGGGFDRTVRRFQKENGLTVDGVMNPGGETETALNTSLSEQIANITRRNKEQEEEDNNNSFRTPGINPLIDTTEETKSDSTRPAPVRDLVRALPSLVLKDRVGNNHTNDHDDMTGIQEQLVGLGYLPERHARAPDLYITKPIEDAIRRFQIDENLKSDGWAGPKGETEQVRIHCNGAG